MRQKSPPVTRESARGVTHKIIGRKKGDRVDALGRRISVTSVVEKPFDIPQRQRASYVQDRRCTSGGEISPRD